MVVQKLTARTSGISKVVKSQTMMTVWMSVTVMMNVNMKAVIKNEKNLTEKLLFEITFRFNFLNKTCYV